MEITPLFLVDQNPLYSIVLPDVYVNALIDPLTTMYVLYLIANHSKHHDLNESIVNFCTEVIDATTDTERSRCVEKLQQTIMRSRLYEITFFAGKYKRKIMPNVDAKIIDEVHKGILNFKSWLPMLNRIRERKALPPKPVVAAIIPTYRCHARCIYCYAPTNSLYYETRERENELTTEEWIEVISKLHKAGVVHLMITGGEPLLRSDLREIAYHAFKLGMWVEISTKVPDLDMLMKVSDYVDKVQISIDMIDNRTQFELIGIRNYVDKALDAISKLTKTNTRIQTNAVITRQTAPDLPEYVETMIDLGVDSIIFSPYFTSFVRVIHNIVPTCEVLTRAFEETLNMLRKRHEVIRLDKHHTYLVDGKSIVYLGLIEIARSHYCEERPAYTHYTCGAFWDGVAIDPYGYVYGCDRMTWFKKLAVGNVKHEDFIKIWRRGSKFLPSRDKFKDYECYKCPYFEECIIRYYCYLQAIIQTGKIFTKPYWRCRLKRQKVKQ